MKPPFVKSFLSLQLFFMWNLHLIFLDPPVIFFVERDDIASLPQKKLLIRSDYQLINCDLHMSMQCRL